MNGFASSRFCNQEAARQLLATEKVILRQKAMIKIPKSLFGSFSGSQLNVALRLWAPNQAAFSATASLAAETAVLEGEPVSTGRSKNAGAKGADPQGKSPGLTQNLNGKLDSKLASRVSLHDTRKDTLVLKDLRAIPGVGPKNAQLLAEAGYTTVDAILKTYQMECAMKPESFLEHLHSRVGIKQRRHRQIIADYFKEQLTSANHVTLSVEGNISAGKSTFLNGITSHCPDLQELIHVAPEPVQKWQNIDGKHNLLEHFYNDQPRFSYIFQNYIFLTRLEQEEESRGIMGGKPYRLLERSVFCDRMVFVESLRNSNLITEMELSIYDKWFNRWQDKTPTLVPDGFIYLRAGPKVCMGRLANRNRDEEAGVSINYLEDLHQRHEDWLYNAHANSHPEVNYELEQVRQSMGVRPELKQIAPMPASVNDLMALVPDSIKNEVKFLDKSKNQILHHSIDQLPALVLDCEKDIHDVEAQKEHASKVNTFFEYVRSIRALRQLYQPPANQPDMSGIRKAMASFMNGIHILDGELQHLHEPRSLVLPSR